MNVVKTPDIAPAIACDATFFSLTPKNFAEGFLKYSEPAHQMADVGIKKASDKVAPLNKPLTPSYFTMSRAI